MLDHFYYISFSDVKHKIWCQNENLEYWEMVFEVGIDFVMLDGPFLCLNIHIFYHVSCVGIWIGKCWIWDHADRIWLKVNVGTECWTVFQIRNLAWQHELMNTPKNIGFNDQKNNCHQHTKFPWATLEVCLKLCLGTPNGDIKICPFLWYSD